MFILSHVPLSAGPFSKLRWKIKAHFPYSIGAAYINASETSVCAQLGNPAFSVQGTAKRQRCYDDKVAILDSVLKSKCAEFGPLSGKVVAHIRLGDAFCVKTEYVRDSLIPPTPEEVFAVAREYMSSEHPFTFIYSAHGTVSSSPLCL